MGRWKIKEDILAEVKRQTKRDSPNFRKLNVDDLVAILKAIDPDIKIYLPTSHPHIRIESNI
jgi:hypothetical protein